MYESYEAFLAATGKMTESELLDEMATAIVAASNSRLIEDIALSRLEDIHNLYRIPLSRFLEEDDNGHVVESVYTKEMRAATRAIALINATDMSDMKQKVQKHYITEYFLKSNDIYGMSEKTATMLRTTRFKNADEIKHALAKIASKGDDISTIPEHIRETIGEHVYNLMQKLATIDPKQRTQAMRVLKWTLDVSEVSGKINSQSEPSPNGDD